MEREMHEYDKLSPVIETKVTHHQVQRGMLEVHTKYSHGQKLSEVFTLESLARVLDMPMTTMEGRYSRGKLHYWNTPITTSLGRPRRAFPIAMLKEVVRVVETRGAEVEHFPNGSMIRSNPTMSPAGPITPTWYDGQNYYTVASLAEYFGMSDTTVRNKLRKAGLLKRFRNLGSGMHGGRPKRAIGESALGDIKLALIDGVKFGTELDRIVAEGQRGQAKQEMLADTVVQTISSMRALDQKTLAPVIPLPVNAVKSAIPRLMDYDPLDPLELDAFSAHLQGLVDGTVPLPPARNTWGAPKAASVDTQPRGTAPQSVSWEAPPKRVWVTQPGEFAQAAVDNRFAVLTAGNRRPTAQEQADSYGVMHDAGATREMADALFDRVDAFWSEGGEQ